MNIYIFIKLNYPINQIQYIKFTYSLLNMKTQTFEEAFNRLKELSEILEQDSIIDVDKLIEYQKEAKKLQEFCRKKIKTSEKELNNNEHKND